MTAEKSTKRSTQNPLRLLARAFALWIGGRVKYTKGINDIVINENGDAFRAFRKVVVRGDDRSSEPPAAIFTVRFTFKNLTPTANRRLSLIPIPFIVAQPGFRSKTWLLGEGSKDFMGYYAFDTRSDAEAYLDSLPLRMMRRRARSVSLRYEIRDSSAAMPPNWTRASLALWHPRSAPLCRIVC